VHGDSLSKRGIVGAGFAAGSPVVLSDHHRVWLVEQLEHIAEYAPRVGHDHGADDPDPDPHPVHDHVRRSP